MIAIKETTNWQLKRINHTYLLDKSRVVAYIPYGTEKPVWFDKSLFIDQRDRTFENVSVELFGISNKKLISVKGSTGLVYQVDIQNRTCTCKGFQYHGHCKHLKSVLTIKE